MAYQLNEKLKNMVPYEPISGNYAIRLDANESFLPLDREIQAELAKKLTEIPFNRYPDPLAEEVCRQFADYYGISADSVSYTHLDVYKRQMQRFPRCSIPCLHR